MTMITGVRFVQCRNHNAIADAWHGEGDDRHPYCGACLRPIRDAELVTRLRRDATAAAAMDRLVQALRSGTKRDQAEARRDVRLYLSLPQLKALLRHLADREAEAQTGIFRAWMTGETAEPTLANQDASGRMPVGVFLDGALVEVAPVADVDGEATRRSVAARLGVDLGALETLLLCHQHPRTAAVNCEVCVPGEG
jgi:hypothetical protein